MLTVGTAGRKGHQSTGPEDLPRSGAPLAISNAPPSASQDHSIAASGNLLAEHVLRPLQTYRPRDSGVGASSVFPQAPTVI